MRTAKDVDFTKVDFITYAVDEYLRDIPMYDLVSNYINLYKYDEDTYIGEYEDSEGIVHKVSIYLKDNICTIDHKPLDGEEIVMLFEGEDVNPNPIIKKITGIDLDDYISDVTYYDGTVELLDVKGKTLLIGKNKRVMNDK